MTRILRKQQKVLTRKKLKATAIKLMVEKGTDNTQISDICKDAEVALGTFYVHFKNKEEILTELITEFNTKVSKSVIKNMTKLFTGSINKAVSTIAENYLIQIKDQKNILIILSGTTKTILPLKLLSEGINPKLRNFISKRIQSISNSTYSPEYIDYLIHAILSVWIGIGVKWAIENKNPPFIQVQKILTDATLSIISNLIPEAVGKPS